MIRIGPVKFPVVPLIAAIPVALRAAAKVVKDAGDPTSPGGAKVTGSEIALAIGAFVAAFGDAITPSVLKANGVTVTDYEAA